MDTSDARDILRNLRASIVDVDALLALLGPPLDTFGLVPRGTRLPVQSASFDRTAIASIFPELQRAVLVKIAPVWAPALKDSGYDQLLDQFFCPVAVVARGYGECVAVLAYSALLSNPLDTWGLAMLEQVCRTYSLSDLYWAVFSGPLWTTVSQQALAWEDLVRLIPTVPTRVANALGGKDCPQALEFTPFNRRLCLEFHDLVASRKPATDSDISALSSMLIKLINTGLFPASASRFPGHVSFFDAILSRELSPSNSSPTWGRLVSSLPTLASRKLFNSLTSHLPDVPAPTGTGLATRRAAKNAANVLLYFTGGQLIDDDVLDELVSVAVQGYQLGTEGMARIVTAAIAMHSVTATQKLLKVAIDTWSEPQFVRHALIQQHRYLTLLVLLAVSNLPQGSATITQLASSPTFLASVSTYLGHADPAIRRCGMLVAEELATRTGRKLAFPGWDGDGEGREWCRAVRELITQRDIDAADDAVPETHSQDPVSNPDTADADEPVESPDHHTDAHPPDSDDESLVGFDSDDESRSGLPDPAFLAEVAKDPSLSVGANKRPRRPVYLMELGSLLRDTPKPDKEDETADKIDVALECAEELIRRKEGFGFELDENAVDLVFAFVNLQDNFGHKDFAARRQNALIALVVCAPTKSTPALIEQYFNDQLSLVQRMSILNALALGARELANLAEPPLQVQSAAAFPSRRLPETQHAQYITQQTDTRRVQALLGSITSDALSRVRDSAPEPTVIQRERQLRVRSPPTNKVVPIERQIIPSSTSIIPAKRHRAPFSALAAEYFIMPLVNRFWQYIGDAQAREARRVRPGAGSAGGLTPQVLSHFLATLGVLLHAGRHSPAFLGVLAPESLGLTIQLGTTRVAKDDDEFGSGGKEQKEGESWEQRQGRVVTAALEVALVVLEGCVELDGGRSIALEHAARVLAVEEWAQGVFEALEKGLRIRGGGGANETRMTAAAAGVAMKVSEILEKWRRILVGL